MLPDVALHNNNGDDDDVVVFNDIVLLLLLEMETSLSFVVSVVVSWSFHFSHSLFAANEDVVVPVVS